MKELAVLGKEQIKNMIYTIRGLQVMLDADLARLYGVSTKRLNQAVKRNIERFPENFMFKLSKEEYEGLVSQSVIPNNDSLRAQNVTLKSKQNLKSQFVTSRYDYGGRRKLLYTFTEQGVAMLSGILKSDTAVKVSIQIMGTFVIMRRFISKNAELFMRLDNVERKQIEY